MTSAPLRFGLAGTGYWARIAHAPALASAEGVEPDVGRVIAEAQRQIDQRHGV